jgi:hypothetical protein
MKPLVRDGTSHAWYCVLITVTVCVNIRYQEVPRVLGVQNRISSRTYCRQSSVTNCFEGLEREKGPRKEKGIAFKFPSPTRARRPSVYVIN